MSDSDQNAPRKLRRWFWVMLLAPAFVSAVGTTLVTAFVHGEQQLGWLIVANMFVGLPLNGICSACCAVHLSRVRTGQTRALWVLAGTLGFFALNLGLSFGGCALGATLGETLGK